MIISDILLILTTLTGGVTTIIAFYKIIICPILKAIKKIKETVNIIEKLQEEFRPNGGNSLKDAISRIERNLLIERETRRALSMASDIISFEADSKGLYIWINKAFMDISGLSSSDAENYGWINTVNLRERDAVLQEWGNAIRQKRVFQMQYHMTNILTGATIKINNFSLPILNDDKNDVIGYVGILTPINI